MECQRLLDSPVIRVRSGLIDPSPGAVSPDVALVQQLDAVPTLLEVLCEITGMRVAAVVRVGLGGATVCAVKDVMGLNLAPGDRFDFEVAVRCGPGEALVVEHASRDLRFHPMPGEQGPFESYASSPIVTREGQHFGHLCVLDPSPTRFSASGLSTLRRFATLIGLQLEDQTRHSGVQKALHDERAASELRDQFIAILGHDLRNPLQAVLASSELLALQLRDTPALADMARRIKVNSKRMSSLIDDVLDFARGRLGGGIGLQLEGDRDIEAGLVSVVKELQEGQPKRIILANISVTRRVHCDVGRIQQMASNLISNALTHGDPQTPVKVMVTTDDHDLVLEVWNQGEPIPAHSIHKIFEPFWRHSTSTDRQGLGLGLHICSQIARAHGGQLSVSSSREEGTRFTARLPLNLLS